MKQIKRGEIYFADLSPVVGSEQTGLRPVLILQNNSGNKHSPTTIVAAITSRKTKPNIPTHVKVLADGLPLESTVSQKELIHRRRQGKGPYRLMRGYLQH